MHEVNEGKTSQFVGTKSDNKKMVYLVLKLRLLLSIYTETL